MTGCMHPTPGCLEQVGWANILHEFLRNKTPQTGNRNPGKKLSHSRRYARTSARQRGFRMLLKHLLLRSSQRNLANRMILLYVYYTILYHTIQYDTIRCYAMLCYVILYYTILYYTILYYTILYYTILYYTILCYTILYYTKTILKLH